MLGDHTKKYYQSINPNKSLKVNIKRMHYVSEISLINLLLLLNNLFGIILKKFSIKSQQNLLI